MKLNLFLTYLLIVSSVSIALAQTNSDNEKITQENKKVERPNNSTIQYKAITNKKEHYLQQEELKKNQPKPKESDKPLPKKDSKGTKNEKDDQ